MKATVIFDMQGETQAIMTEDFLDELATLFRFGIVLSEDSTITMIRPDGEEVVLQLHGADDV